MYIELTTDDPAVVHKAIAEATPTLAAQETLLVTVQRAETQTSTTMPLAPDRTRTPSNRSPLLPEQVMLLDVFGRLPEGESRMRPAMIAGREVLTPDRRHVMRRGVVLVVRHSVDTGRGDRLSRLVVHGAAPSLWVKPSAYQRSLKWSSIEQLGHRAMDLPACRCQLRDNRPRKPVLSSSPGERAPRLS
jgi:hypothetical protein